MKHLKDLDHYLIGTFNFPVKPKPPKPEGEFINMYECPRGMDNYIQVLSDFQKDELEYAVKLYDINQRQFKQFIMAKHAELKADIMAEFNLSETEYKALVNSIRKRGLTASIELIYKEVTNITPSAIGGTKMTDVTDPFAYFNCMS